MKRFFIIKCFLFLVFVIAIGINLQKKNHIMTPSKQAVELAKKAVTMFSIKN